MNGLVQEALSQRLRGFVTVNGWLLMDPPFSVIFQGDMPDFSKNLLLYAAEVFADQCRDLLLFGVAESAFSVVFAQDHYRFFLRVKFTDAVSLKDRDLLSVTPTRELADLASTLNKLLTPVEVAGAVDMPKHERPDLFRVAVDMPDLAVLTVLLEVRAEAAMVASG